MNISTVSRQINWPIFTSRSTWSRFNQKDTVIIFLWNTLQIDAKISLWVTSWNRARVIRFNPMQTFLQTMPTQLPTKNGVPQLTRYQSPGTKSVKHLSPKDMVLGFMLLLPVRWISDLFYPGSLYEWWVLDQILVTGEIRTLFGDL